MNGDFVLLRCSRSAEVVQFADLRDLPESQPADRMWNACNACSLMCLALPHSLRYRLQHAWEALRGRRFCYHEVILAESEVLRLRDWLDRYVQR